MTPRIPGKRQILLAFLEKGVAMVHLDARQPGVEVPEQYAAEAHLRLNLSYRYQIPDMKIDDEYVKATLSFGGRPFRCVMPWRAIFGITSQTSGDGQVWPEDLPAEVSGPHPEAPAHEEPQRPAAPQPLRLKAVEPAAPAEARPDSPKPPDGPAPRHLRLVR